MLGCRSVPFPYPTAGTDLTAAAPTPASKPTYVAKHGHLGGVVTPPEGQIRVLMDVFRGKILGNVFRANRIIWRMLHVSHVK
eukprot:1194577-Prorocentrum_minimum.AAC.4